MYPYFQQHYFLWKGIRERVDILEGHNSEFLFKGNVHSNKIEYIVDHNIYTK